MIQNTLAAFHLDQKLSQLAKDSINRTVSMLYRFCAAGCPEIERSVVPSLHPEDQNFFVQYQLEKKLTQIQITTLSCFSSWRNRQGLTGFHGWLKESEEIGNQGLQAFSEAEKLPQEAVKEAISSAVRKICQILTEIQSQGQKIQIQTEEQPQEQTPASSSIFGHVPDLPGAQLIQTQWPMQQPFQRLLHQSPLNEADEALWCDPISGISAIHPTFEPESITLSGKSPITLEAMGSSSLDYIELQRGLTARSTPCFPQSTRMAVYQNDQAILDFFQEATGQATGSSITFTYLSALEVFAKWCYQRGLSGISIAVDKKQSQAMDQLIAAFQQSERVCDSAKLDIHHAINALRQCWTDHYARNHYIKEEDFQIPQGDAQLLDNFYQAALQQNAPPIAKRLISELKAFSQWCNQQGLLPLQNLMSLGEAIIQNTLALFCLNQKLSQPEKDSINDNIVALYQFCATGQVGFVLHPEDQTFFEQHQLERKLTQSHMISLRCFSEWRNQQRLTSLRQWIKEPEETANQNLQVFIRDGFFPQKFVKRVIANAVRRLREVLAEIQNQGHPVQNEEQTPDGTLRQALAQAEQRQTFSLSSLFEQAPDLTRGQLTQTQWPAHQPYQSLLNQTPLNEADEALRRSPIFDSVHLAPHTDTLFNSLSEPSVAPSQITPNVVDKVYQNDQMLLNFFQEATGQATGSSNTFTYLSTLEAFAKWCYQQGFSGISIAVDKKKSKAIGQSIAAFQQSETACESAKLDIHHAINALRQCWTDRYARNYD